MKTKFYRVVTFESKSLTLFTADTRKECFEWALANGHRPAKGPKDSEATVMVQELTWVPGTHF